MVTKVIRCGIQEAQQIESAKEQSEAQELNHLFNEAVEIVREALKRNLPEMPEHHRRAITMLLAA